MFIPDQKIKSVRIAATADIHHGHPRSRDFEFGTLPQWEAWFKGAQLAGAQVLILAGDTTHTGNPRNALEIGNAAKNFSGHRYAIHGNHELKEGKVEKVTQALESQGITVLDDTADILEVNGIKLGLVGFNGSLDPTLFHQLHNALPKADRIKRIQELTQQRYMHPFLENIRTLLKAKVDCIIPVIHVPIHVEQYSDKHTREQQYLPDMTPQVYKRLRRVKRRLGAVVGGHVHSLDNPKYRRDDPMVITKEEMTLLNVAAPNAISQENNPIFLFDVVVKKNLFGQKVSVQRVSN